MARNKIEIVIDELISSVFKATFNDGTKEELFQQTEYESWAAYDSRVLSAIEFMQSTSIDEIRLEKLAAPKNTFQVTDGRSGASIQLSNPNATQDNLLFSDNFPKIIETIKSFRGQKPTLYQAIEMAIKDPALSPTMFAIKLSVKAEGLCPLAWREFVDELILNSELCDEKNRRKLIAKFNEIDTRNKAKLTVEQPLVLISPTLTSEDKEKFEELCFEFEGLLKKLQDKIDDLKDREELIAFGSASALYGELNENWRNYLLGNSNITALKQACDECVSRHGEIINTSRGGEWKQWFADLGCWLLKVLTLGCVAIEDYKITTDTMAIALEMKENVASMTKYGLFSQPRFADLLSQTNVLTVEERNRALIDAAEANLQELAL